MSPVADGHRPNFLRLVAFVLIAFPLVVEAIDAREDLSPKAKAYREWRLLGFQFLSELAIVDQLAKQIPITMFRSSSAISTMTGVPATLLADLSAQDAAINGFTYSDISPHIKGYFDGNLGVHDLRVAAAQSGQLADSIYWEGTLSNQVNQYVDNIRWSSSRKVWTDEIKIATAAPKKDLIDKSFDEGERQASNISNIGKTQAKCIAGAAWGISDGLKALVDIASRNSVSDRKRVTEILKKVRENRSSQGMSLTDCSGVAPRNYCGTSIVKGSREYYRRAAQAINLSLQKDDSQLVIDVKNLTVSDWETRRNTALVEIAAGRNLVIRALRAKSECAP